MRIRKENKVLNFWYMPLIAGFLFILLSIGVMVTPITSFLLLTAFLSIGVTISGLLDFIYSVVNKKTLKNWGWYLIVAIINIIVGTYLLLNLGLSALMLSVFIGVLVMTRSIMTIVKAFHLKRDKTKPWIWVLITGIIGVGFSVLMILNPIYSGIVTTIWMAIGLLFIGISHIFISLLLNRIRKGVKNIEKLKEEDYTEDVEHYEVE